MEERKRDEEDKKIETKSEKENVFMCSGVSRNTGQAPRYAR
jgi:hypothetical protein